VSHSVEAVVYVHGISQHDIGYSDAWYDALRPHLGRRLQKHEVRWSDLVNVAPMMATEADTAKLIEEEQLRQQIHAELEARKVRNGQVTPPVTGRNADKQYQAMTFALDDFVRYMVWESTRNSILSRFDEVVVPMLNGGRTLHVIAHSWGTVVAYEGLRRRDYKRPSGRIANLITLGSALSIGPVQANLFRRVTDGRLPQVVDAFINVDAGGDIVGGPLAPHFKVTEEYLRQKPTGCSTFWLSPKTARSFTCAHSSYFQTKNYRVQRDIIAHYINKSTSQT
jgi:hypothetical protein